MSLVKQFLLIINRQANKYESNVRGLAEELTNATPVDTGNMKKAWSLKKTGKFSYKIENNAPYSSIIAGGRRMINGKMYGSEQLPMGFDPIIEKFKRSKI